MPNIDPTLVILGLVMPFFVALAKQSGLNPTINSAIAIVAYILGAILWMIYNQVPFTVDTITTNATTLTVIGLTAYKMFWSSIGASAGPDGKAVSTDSLDSKITDKTSISKFKAEPLVKPIIGQNEAFA